MIFVVCWAKWKRLNFYFMRRNWINSEYSLKRHMPVKWGIYSDALGARTIEGCSSVVTGVAFGALGCSAGHISRSSRVFNGGCQMLWGQVCRWYWVWWSSAQRNSESLFRRAGHFDLDCWKMKSAQVLKIPFLVVGETYILKKNT